MISPATTHKSSTATTVPVGGQTLNSGRKKPRHLEDTLQAVCVKWFRMQYSHLSSLLFAIPNGGQRNAREGARLKAQGVTAGVPDLMLAVPNPAWPKRSTCGLFLELKVGKNTLSDAQKDVITQLGANGYAVAVVRSFDEFQAAIKAHLGR